ncbi:hypothetical protein [Lysobacter sp. HA35]
MGEWAAWAWVGGVILVVILFYFVRRGEQRSGSAPLTTQANDERVTAAVKQGLLFMTASMAMVNFVGLHGKMAKRGVLNYLGGVVDALTQHYKLDDSKSMLAIYFAYREYGLSENDAKQACHDLEKAGADPFVLEAMTRGGRDVLDWLGKNDDNAPMRLADLVGRWEQI